MAFLSWEPRNSKRRKRLLAVSLENLTRKRKGKGGKKSELEKKEWKKQWLYSTFYSGCFGDSLWPQNTAWHLEEVKNPAIYAVQLSCDQNKTNAFSYLLQTVPWNTEVIILTINTGVQTSSSSSIVEQYRTPGLSRDLTQHSTWAAQSPGREQYFSSPVGCKNKTKRKI